LACIMALPLWRSSRSVFLDRACIHQSDAVLRKLGVDSIGAFLKMSKFMVVLWDPTYVTRLWCVFEMAAYLKTHDTDKDKRKRLIIRPLMLGPVSFAMFVGCVLVYMYYLLSPPSLHPMIIMPLWVPLCVTPVLHALRKYHRRLSTLKEQCHNFSVDGAFCHCCTVAHVDRNTGEVIPCDRELVEACIVSWFGDMSSFEDEVRTHLYSNFARQLGNHAFPYHWLVCSMCPTVWAHFDIFAAKFRIGMYVEAAATLVYALTFWLCVIPLFFVWCVKSAALLRRKCRAFAGADIWVSAFIALVSAVPCAGIWWATYLPSQIDADTEIIRSLVFFGIFAPLSAAAWRATCSCCG